MAGEHMLIGFRRSSSRAQKQIKAMQGNCKIYCSKLNYGILVKHNILNFCGSITGLLNYSCDQGMTWNLWLPFCRQVNQAQCRGTKAWMCFLGMGIGTHITWVLIWLRFVSCLPFPAEYRDYPSAQQREGANSSLFWLLLWGFGCSYGIRSLVTWTRTQNRVTALGWMPMDSAPIFQLIGIQLRRPVLCREKFII